MRAWPVVVSLCVAGCFHPTAPAGAPCSDTEPCPSPQTCVAGACSLGGGSDDAASADGTPVVPDTCSGIQACVGNRLVGCGAPPIVCDDGCVATGGAHCGAIVPSNVAWSDAPASPGTLELGSGPYHLDTAAGTLLLGAQLVALPAGVTLSAVGGYRVLALGNLIMDSGASLRVLGDRPLIVLATGDVTLAAGSIIDVGAGCADDTDPTCAGPGGGTGTVAFDIDATGCGPGKNGNENVFGLDEAAGGGGGAATAGGDGGGTMQGLGIPGIACGTPQLVPLIGGSGGGAGGVNPGAITGGRGGGGGGALQITAGHTLASSGTLTAGGNGGETGHPVNGGGGGGGGGGAGGGILLEGSTVTLAGGSIVAANGGGGGGNAIGALGRGQAGHHDATCAAGGAAGQFHNPGGIGACAANPPGNGSVATSTDRGGGGGAVGWIHVRAVASSLTGVSSPAPTSEVAPVN